MSCSKGFISVPKANAPERFSLQTGLICNLFGVQHPLCKWVDELLPELPFSDVGKDIAKRLRNKLKNKISSKLLEEFGIPSQIHILKDFEKKIKEVNQIIDDVWDTIQGGEISTLEFCLAGKPNLPESINWGDIFLAFSRVYPDSLLNKLSQIIAFEKYFELCECKRKPESISLDELPLENSILPQIPPAAFFNTPCGQVAEQYYNNNLLPVIQKLNTQLNTVQGILADALDDIWTANYRNASGVDFEDVEWEIIPCPDDNEIEFYDTQGQIGVINLAPSNSITSCCRLYVRHWKRFFRYGKVDIKFTFDFEGQRGVIYDAGGLVPTPCLTDNYIINEINFKVPIRVEDNCQTENEPYPDDYDFREIEPIEPYDPCDSEYAENYGDLCNCPPVNNCQPQKRVVKIVRNCAIGFEPRSLYLP